MQKTVLIADDDHFTCELLKYIVESQALRALTCQDGHEMLMMLRKEMVHIIFLDALMPRMNGFEALRKLELEERTRAIPKILMTGIYKYEQIKENLSSINLIQKVLYKPIALDQFQSLIEENLKIKFTSQVFFPDTIRRKPGFEKRIDVKKSLLESKDQSKRMLMVPKSGNLNQFRLGQLLQYTASSGGPWQINIESSIVSGGFQMIDGSISAYWSANESDFQELSFRDKMTQFCSSIFKRTSNGQHAWEQGTNATAFTGFLYRLTTSFDGQYTLEKSSDLPSSAKPITGMSVDKILREMISSSFNPDLIHNHLPVAGTIVKVSDHCKPLPTGIELSEKQKKLFYLVERNMPLQDVLRQSDEGSADTLQTIFCLWLAGVLEIHRKIQVHTGLAPAVRRIRTVEPTVVHPITPDVSQDHSVTTSEPVAPIDKPSADGAHDPEKPISHIDHGKPASRKEKDILHLYHLGIRAQYYDFLGVSPRCSEEELIAVLKKAKTCYVESEDIMQLPDESIRRFQSLNLLVKLSISMLGKPKTRSRYDAAISEENPERRTTFAQQHYDIGLMYLAEQHLHRGIAELSLAIRLDPSKEDAYLQLMQNLVQDPDGFAIVFDLAVDAVDRFPGQTDFRIVLGQCFKEIGQLEKATAEFLKVLDIDPENAEAMQHLLSVPGQNADLGYVIE